VRVDGRMIPLSELVDNPGSRYLLHHPQANGRLCRWPSEPTHDPQRCTYIHRFAFAVDQW
jgi:hypothetical protein